MGIGPNGGGRGLRRSEPFRALLEEARAAEQRPASAPAPAPALTLAQRLDQMLLAGGTPARGTLVPSLERILEPSARAAATDALLEAMEARQEEPTRPMPAGRTVDAALQDSLAELEATLEIPAQRRAPLRRETATLTAVPAVPTPSVPEPVLLKDVPRPPPLPAAKPKSRPAPVATHAPAPVLSDVVPVPRVVQVMGDDNTIPGLSPGSRSSSSSSGKVLQQSDQYRLQLEFEDTPARPLPRIAFVPPPPLPPSAKKAAKAPAAAPDLGDLENIDDLQAMARALGLDGVGDVSIPSLEGLPIPLALDDEDISLPDLTASAELFDDGDVFASASVASDVRRALAEELLDISQETAFPERRSSQEGGTPRPALLAGKAVTPVIVKIPSRPKVSMESRERARRLYLEAVEKLAKGDRTAAVLHLKLAIDYDDGIPLYRDLLAQLEGTPRPARAPEPPALTVLGPQGQRSQARDHWRSARPR